MARALGSPFKGANPDMGGRTGNCGIGLFVDMRRPKAQKYVYGTLIAMAPTKYRFFPWFMSIRCPVCRGWVDLSTVSASFQCPECGSKLVATKWVAIVQLLVFLVTFLPLLWFLAGKIAIFVYDGPVDYGDVRFVFWMF